MVELILPYWKEINFYVLFLNNVSFWLLNSLKSNPKNLVYPSIISSNLLSTIPIFWVHFLVFFGKSRVDKYHLHYPELKLFCTAPMLCRTFGESFQWRVRFFHGITPCSSAWLEICRRAWDWKVVNDSSRWWMCFIFKIFLLCTVFDFYFFSFLPLFDIPPYNIYVCRFCFMLNVSGFVLIVSLFTGSLIRYFVNTVNLIVS